MIPFKKKFFPVSQDKKNAHPFWGSNPGLPITEPVLYLNPAALRMAKNSIEFWPFWVH